MARSLFIQLARFGDLMQTAPLVSAAVNASPPEEVHLLVDSSLESTAGMIKGVAGIHIFDRSAFSKELAVNDLHHAYQRVFELAMILQALKFDKVINITHTPESAWLAKLSGAKKVSGLTGERGKTFSEGNWSRLFRATLSRRDLGSFHLVDLHMKLAGLGSPLRSESWLKVPNAPIPDLTTDSPLLTIQLGANNPLRMWQIASFAEVAKQITEALPNLRLVLVGSKAEQPLAAEFEQVYGKSVNNLVGRTNLNELAGVISRSSLLLSGDTGTIHLAAALNIPTVGVYLGMARADDTAPYRAGSIIFEPKRDCYPCPENNRCGHLACHSDIPPTAVAEAAFKLISSGSTSPVDEESFRSRIVDFDDDDCLNYRDESASLSLSHRQLMRKFWLNEFSPLSATSSTRTRNHSNRELGEPAEAALAASRRFELALIGGNQVAKAREILMRNLKDIEIIANQSDDSGLLAHLFQLELENLPADPRLIAGKIKSSLESLNRRVMDFPSRQNLPLRAAV